MNLFPILELRSFCVSEKKWTNERSDARKKANQRPVQVNEWANGLEVEPYALISYQFYPLCANATKKDAGAVDLSLTTATAFKTCLFHS